ncbi:hypothetical protein HDU67_000009 [Dinochytrium kinnereticum]|nr:hypothetical protein HDU67_000009 [Dinochytrium kinnereticum]
MPEDRLAHAPPNGLTNGANGDSSISYGPSSPTSEKRSFPNQTPKKKIGPPKRVMSLNLLSISDFTDSKLDGRISSSNVGVVCDKVIYQKIKWMLAMDMAAAAAKQLQVETMNSELQITLETEDGCQVATITQYTGFDISVDDIERNLIRQVSVLFQTLQRYNLLRDVQAFYPSITMETSLAWQLISFTHLRRRLVDLFSKQTHTTPLIKTIPERKHSDMDLIAKLSKRENDNALRKSSLTNTPARQLTVKIEGKQISMSEEDMSPLAHVLSVNNNKSFNTRK